MLYIYIYIGWLLARHQTTQERKAFTKAALSRKRELFTCPTYGLADGMVGPIFKKGGLDNVFQQYKQCVTDSHCSAYLSKPVDIGNETRTDHKPPV